MSPPFKLAPKGTARARRSNTKSFLSQYASPHTLELLLIDMLRSNKADPLDLSLIQILLLEKGAPPCP